MQLTQVRESIYEELSAYPRREYTAVKRRWLYLGLFGGHRAYLGQDRMATFMALSFGGLGIWWLKDRLKLAKMTDDWNADQAHRQANGLPPKEVDGLVLVTPETLESPPTWTDNPLDKILGLIFTLPVVLMAAMGNILKPVLEKVPIIGPFLSLIHI